MLAWLDRRPRITFHFTPTSASKMNQIERWFGILPARPCGGAAPRSWSRRFGRFTANWNTGSTPFVRTKTADEILAKAVRKDRAIGQLRHYSHPDPRRSQMAVEVLVAKMTDFMEEGGHPVMARLGG